jgi:hypothetical protein
VFPPPGTRQVFRPPDGGLDKSSAAVPSKERRKRHGPPRWTTDGENADHAGGSARGVLGALRGPEPQQQDRPVVRRPDPTIRRLVRHPGDQLPVGSSLSRPRAVRPAPPPSGLRAQHGARVRPRS